MLSVTYGGTGLLREVPGNGNPRSWMLDGLRLSERLTGQGATPGGLNEFTLCRDQAPTTGAGKIDSTVIAAGSCATPACRTI